MSSYTSSSLTLRSLLKSAGSRLRLGLPARKVSGLTAPAKALFAAAAAERGLTLLVVPTDGDVETMTADARFFFSALEGLSDAEVERAVLPFPSHEVDPYRGLAPHFDIASARAACPARADDRHCPAGGRVRRRRSSRVSARRSASSQTAITLDARPGHLSDRSRRPARGRGLHAAGSGRRERRVLRSRRRRRLLSRRRRASRSASSSSATRSSRSALRSLDPALDRRRSTRLRSLRSRNCSATGRPDRSATVFDYLWCQRQAHRARVRARRRHGARREADRSRSWRATTKRVAKGNRARSAGRAGRRRGTRPRAGSKARRRSRRCRSTRRRAHRAVSRRWSSPAASRTGSAEIRRGREARRHDRLRRQLAGPRRAHDRAARRLRDLRGPDRARRGRRGPRPCSSASATCRAGSACRKPAFSSGPRPTSSRKSARRTSAAGRRRAPSSPTSATSRSATSSSMSTTASACSSA